MNEDQVIAQYVTDTFVERFFEDYYEVRNRYAVTEALLEDALEEMEDNEKQEVIDIIGDYMEGYF